MNFTPKKINVMSRLFSTGEYMVHAYNAQEHFSLVWSTSTNFKANYLEAPCEPRITHIRPRTLKRKSGCPSGINKINFKCDICDAQIQA